MRPLVVYPEIAMTDQPDEASRLAGLLNEIEALENTRMSLLKRVERVRSNLLAAGDRTMAMRASVELLCDHVTDVMTTAAEFSMLEHELQELEIGVEQTGRESAGIAFESESFQETLKDADDDMERLSALLLERKVKPSRGH